MTIGSKEQLSLATQKSLNSKAPIMHPSTFQTKRLGPQQTKSKTPMILAILSMRHASKIMRIGKENQAIVRVIDMPRVHRFEKLKISIDCQSLIAFMSHFISIELIPNITIAVQQQLQGLEWSSRSIIFIINQSCV